MFVSVLACLPILIWCFAFFWRGQKTLLTKILPVPVCPEISSPAQSFASLMKSPSDEASGFWPCGQNMMIIWWDSVIMMWWCTFIKIVNWSIFLVSDNNGFENKFISRDNLVKRIVRIVALKVVIQLKLSSEGSIQLKCGKEKLNWLVNNFPTGSPPLSFLPTLTFP